LSRIHIFGASASGTTTLGAAVAARLGLAHLDTDHFFWLPTEPPFTAQRPAPERVAMLRAAVDAASRGWTLSGSLMGWGDGFVAEFGRSLARHRAWLASLPCRVIELDGAADLAGSVDAVVQAAGAA
jgi:hypothetical protein